MRLLRRFSLLASMGIGFSDNSFRSGIRAPLSLRAFCFAEGVAISYLIIEKE
ncbi:hypothetical protein H5T88_04685 [bacterium]|nr:hypothetical protein [bacterium]